jgi:hypothetical protein
MNKNLWIGVLTALNAVLFGIIFSFREDSQPPVTTVPPAPVQRPAPASAPAPFLAGWDDGRWPDDEKPEAVPRAPAERPESPITTADINPAASLELTAEFADSVRRARAAGLDEVLLAHAVVAQFHRQIETIQFSPGPSPDDASRDAARAEAVIGLLGENAYRGWLRSDFLASQNLLGTDITDVELEKFMRIHEAKEKSLAELWQNGRLDGGNYRQKAQTLQEEYQRQLVSAFGRERAGQLGLTEGRR